MAEIGVEEFLSKYSPDKKLKIGGFPCSQLVNLKMDKPTNLIGEQMASLIFYYTLTFNSEYPDFSNTKTVKIFSKNLPVNPVHRKISLEFDNFGREINFFTDLLPEMKRFCKNRMGSSSLVDEIFPEVYFAAEGSILMEDLRFKGFVMLDSSNKQSFEESKSSLKTLAKFNAITYGMIQEIGSAQIQEKYPCTREVVFRPERASKEKVYMEPAVRLIVQIFKESTVEGSDIILQRLLPFEGRLVENFLEFIGKKDYLFPVIGHGDFWNSNLMYRFNPQGEIDSAKLLDFTDLRVSSPNIDICFFMFCDVKPEVRAQSWRELLQEYFSEFQRVSQLLQIELQFSFNDFLKDFRRYCLMGVLNGVRFTVEASVLGFVNMEELTNFDTDCKKAYSDWLEANRSNLDDYVKRIMNIFKDYDEITSQIDQI